MTRIDDIARIIDAGGQHVQVGGIFGSARAWLTARIAAHFSRRLIVVLCPTEERALQMLADTALLLPHAMTARARAFPDADVLPYLKLSPDSTRWADRIERLHELARGDVPIIVAGVTAAMRAAPPPRFISHTALKLCAGERRDREDVTRWLAEHGFVDVGLVEDEGSFAVRGALVDVWPPTLDNPVRIEFDGDAVADMRCFNPASQRSQQRLAEVILVPAGDICFTPEMTERALGAINERASRRDTPAPEKRRILELVRERVSFPGIETLAPLFMGATATLLDFLPDDALVILDEPDEIRQAARLHREKIEGLFNDSTSIETLIEPDELYLPVEQLLTRAQRHATITLQATDCIPGNAAVQCAIQTTADLRSLMARHAPGDDVLTSLTARLDEWKRTGLRTAFVCHTEMQSQRMIDLFRAHGLMLIPRTDDAHAVLSGESRGPFALTGRLTEGFVWHDESVAVATDEEIFGRKIPRRAPSKTPIEHFTSFAELAEGDLLVHEDHGIGRFRGLGHLTINGLAGDYLLLEYLGGDKLYLPVYRMNLVQRYVGSGDTPPPLDRLGATRWSRVKQSVRRAILAMAKDLLSVHAARQVYPGFAYPSSDPSLEEFSAAFPYDETPDQLGAIDDVIRDMEREQPMDRLVCGDVGYGKTEVAMRAAYKAASAGKQTAVLVPTTILALQHYENFIERFSGTPVRIEMLSRFRTPTQQKEIALDLGRGTVDIVIGTHRMLSKDVSFKDLGLMVIDEEQRFGVRHKERLKKYKETVDVLTLTATPIPRTLHFSLIGIRDISVINTPPANRLSIVTHVVPFDEGIIRHAVITEIGRGGQVFFVHNRVRTMPSMFARLTSLVPEASIVMGHGQMTESELEDVMISFLEKRHNVLLCTAIIESGLDIPSANTIIVNRADTFGLAQLYQLRGRVGRSDVKAQAYLLTPDETTMTPAAKKRLMVLKRFTELGSGFQIATHDLEIRGSGNILGAAQSGHVAEVGYELYTKLLARTIRRLSGKEVREDIVPELNLGIEAFLPNAYIAEDGTRLDCYRRLAACDDDAQIDAMAQELCDRFGTLPPEAQRLIGVMGIKLQAERLRMRQLSFDGRVFACRFDPTTPIDPAALARAAAAEPKTYKLHPPDGFLAFTGNLGGPDAILKEARNLLSLLDSCARGR